MQPSSVDPVDLAHKEDKNTWSPNHPLASEEIEIKILTAELNISILQNSNS